MITMDYYGDLGIFLYLTPIILALAFGFSLLIKRERTTPQIFLGVAFFVVSAAMFVSFWFDRYHAGNFETMRPANIISTLFCVVSAMLYFNSLLRPQIVTKRCIILVSLVTVAYSVLVFVLCGRYGQLRVYATILNVLFEIYFVISLMLTFRRYSRILKSNFSYDENINLRWVNGMIILFVVFSISDAIWLFNDTIAAKLFFNISSLIVIVLLYILGFRQGGVPALVDTFSEDIQPDIEQKEVAADAESQEKLSVIQTKFNDYFLKKSPYLNPDLTLSDIASALSLNTTYLSRVINRDFGFSFYDYVNNYRIDHAIKMLREDESVKTEYIYTSSGFKSKSVFYRLFRERTGMTPQEFVKKSQTDSPLLP